MGSTSGQLHVSSYMWAVQVGSTSGQLHVGSYMWAVICGQYKWAVTCKQLHVGSYIWAVTCGQLIYRQLHPLYLIYILIKTNHITLPAVQTVPHGWVCLQG